MPTITIKSSNGTILAQVLISTGSKRVFTLMKEDYIILKFSLASPLHFKIGSYVDIASYTGVGIDRYQLTDQCLPKQNASTGGWDYEMQLDAHYIKFKNKIFKYIPNAGDSAEETSWNLTATLATHMGVFLNNLSSLGYDYCGTPYAFSIDSSVSDSAKLISYESTSLLDALYSMADTYECEMWVENNIIHFGKCEFGDAIEFRQDINVETMSAEGNRADYATRIYAFGSDRNLPKDYRPTSQNVVVNGVVQKRLMLPAGTPYIDAEPGMTTEEAVEGVVLFDDIYPRTESLISDILTEKYDEKDDDGNATGETWNAYRFNVAGFTFKEEYILPDTDLQVVFMTGKLAGMTFNVKFNPDGESESSSASQIWEIIRNEDYGRPIPDEILKPAIGDKIVLVGWDTTKIASLGLIEDAERELEQKAREKIAELKIDPANYRCKMISATMFDNGGIWHPYTLGSKVLLINPGCFASGERESRIIGYEYDLVQPFNSPIYVVGEKSSTSRTKELEEKVEALTLAGQTYTSSGGNGVYLIRTNDTTSPSDSNVFSALRTKRDFLSRVSADTALQKITFNDGLDSNGKATLKGGTQFGANYASGMTGMGGYVDALGNAELESLAIRSWLEVPELRFNHVEVILGDRWNAPGGGIIESVEIDTDASGNALRTGTITLKLEDKEIGAIAVDDLCKGYFHDFTNAANNATADVDDSKGNTEFSGFCTVFFTITEILNDDGSQVTAGQTYAGSKKKFKYLLRRADGTDGDWSKSFHPFEAMHFVSFGNFTDESRQKSAYETRSYTRYLTGVDTWEFSMANIAMQFGELSNLSVFGQNMVGYSAYLQNIYMSGTISNVHIEVPETIEVTSDGDNFIADGETLTLTATAKKGWETLTPDSWSISRYTGDTAADSAWDSAHTNFAGTITMTQADIGATTLNATAIFTITATGDGWTASKQVVLRTLRLPSTLSMRFVSEYGAYDTFITYGDTVKFQALIEDGLRNDYTAEYDQWSIQRHNGDTPDDIASDGVWNVTRASISSAGVFSIEWSAQHDDLQAERATFIVTAQKGSAMATQITGTLSI